MDSSMKEKQPASFHCSQCSRSYSRIDHLSRHARSHLQQKPFRCETCLRGFTRRDLLQRHLASHGAPNNRSQATQAHQGRTERACQACAAAKVKCEDSKPCKRCLLRHILCEPRENELWLGVEHAIAQGILDLSPDVIFNLTERDILLLHGFAVAGDGVGQDSPGRLGS